MAIAIASYYTSCIDKTRDKCQHTNKLAKSFSGFYPVGEAGEKLLPQNVRSFPPKTLSHTLSVLFLANFSGMYVT